jgi:hypothetical protein
MGQNRPGYKYVEMASMKVFPRRRGKKCNQKNTVHEERGYEAENNKH